MDAEKINILVAKIDGWKYDGCSWLSPADERWGQRRSGGRIVATSRILPNYAKSYDAILPVIQKQNEKGRANTVMILLNSRELGQAENHWSVLEATPLELCIALLKTKGIEV